MTQDIAQDGWVYVCMACGKTAKDPYNGPRGWDESCFLNCELIEESKLVYRDGSVVEVKE